MSQNTELVRTGSELQPASFERAKPLTSGQKRLMKLLTDKISSGKMIVKDDIIETYWQTVCDKDGEIWRYRQRLVGKYPDNKWEGYLHEYFRTDFYIATSAMNWFKTNLGVCILKGKLLAIPVIDLN